MLPCCSQSARSHKQDGPWAWYVCFCATISVTIHMGISNCFAVPLPILLNEFNETKERLGWLGSVAVSLTFFPTPLAGVFCERYGCRLTSLIGAVICAIGLVVTSFAKSLLLMYFSYGVMFGVGSCFIHTGCVFVVTKYFNKRRSFATGMLGAAHSLGIITFGPLLQEAIDAIGWRNMYRILAGLFGLVLFLVLSFDPNVEDPHTAETKKTSGREDKKKGDQEVEKQEKEEPKQKFTLRMFKEPAYVLALASLTIGTFGTLVTFVHLIKYGEERLIPAQKAANLFTLIGGSALVSSVISGRVLDIKRVSPFHVNQFSNCVLGLSLILLPQCSEYIHFAFFAVFFGLGFGSLLPTIYLLLLNVEPRLRIYAYPVGEAIVSVGSLGGAPFAGFIADVTGSYIPAFYTSGSLLLFAVLLVLPIYCCNLEKSYEPDELHAEQVLDIDNDYPRETQEQITDNVIVRTKIEIKNDTQKDPLSIKNGEPPSTGIVNETLVTETKF